MKFTTFALTAAITGTVILSSCTGKSGQKSSDEGVTQYRNLLFSETPYDTERGTHQITSEEAKTINNYTFLHDESGRLLSVEFKRDTNLLGYSSMGAAKITYEYKDNQQIKRYFNNKGEQIENGGVFTAVYSLDEKGIRNGLKFYGKDGQPVENRNLIHSWVWSILPDGMVKENRFNLAGQEVVMNQFCPFYELRFTYNDKGYVTRMANYMADTLYNCTAENCGDIGVSYFSFTPNEHGDLLGFEVFNVTGLMSNLYWGWSKRSITVDENGYVTESLLYDQDNEFVGGNQVPVTKNVYDEHGAVIETHNLDKDKNLYNNPQSGVAITAYQYDETGQRTGTVRYDKDRVEVKQ